MMDLSRSRDRDPLFAVACSSSDGRVLVNLRTLMTASSDLLLFSWLPVKAKALPSLLTLRTWVLEQLENACFACMKMGCFLLYFMCLPFLPDKEVCQPIG
ncbi:hypothetical protein MANES_09G057201v8 [Manihot esculenta]|uniref:Uncharacterized protein n=1 Tax=Manihot esculenta TaxID=3983 RepID=A0ACB7H4G4_MANES|nr:hypothetical protein MANES_09G057201v8 [Manihot esculenta]